MISNITQIKNKEKIMGTVLGIVKGVCTATGAVVLTLTGVSIIYGVVAKKELEAKLKNEIKK